MPVSQTYVPETLEQAEPPATHLPSRQQPAPRQRLPGQQFSPGAPHLVHLPLLQMRPSPVQSLLLQQGWSNPPHAPQPPATCEEHAPANPPPQLLPAAMHLSLAQQLSPWQRLLSQQGCPVPPQAWNVPATQIASLVGFGMPGATHRFFFVSRQAPPVQALSGAQGG
jgi:hypothetical protein